MLSAVFHFINYKNIKFNASSCGNALILLTEAIKVKIDVLFSLLMEQILMFLARM
jgi:hypothetical protein